MVVVAPAGVEGDDGPRSARPSSVRPTSAWFAAVSGKEAAVIEAHGDELVRQAHLERRRAERREAVRQVLERKRRPLERLPERLEENGGVQKLERLPGLAERPLQDPAIHARLDHLLADTARFGRALLTHPLELHRVVVVEELDITRCKTVVPGCDAAAAHDRQPLRE